MTKDILDINGSIIGHLTLPDNTPDVVWSEKLSAYLYTPIPLTNEQALDLRIEWGYQVIKNFRLYSLTIPDLEGLSLLGNLMDVKACLELGMLAASADLLLSKPADDILDSQYPDDLRTVRQRFVDMILTEGPTP